MRGESVLDTKYLDTDLRTAGLGDLREIASLRLTPLAEQARDMYGGHHLGRPIGGGESNFDYWRGPMVRLPSTATEQQRRESQSVVDEFQTALRRSFTSTNFVREVLRREVSSCTAAMSWNLRDTSEQATMQADSEKTLLEQELEKLFSAYWRTNGKETEKAIREAVTCARREGRAVLRFRVAGGALEQGPDGSTRVRTGLEPERIARYIRLEAIPTPESVRLWEDPDTFLKSAVYGYEDARGNACAEVCFCPDEGGKTLLRVLRQGDGENAPPIELDLGERLTYIELDIEPLITRQFLENQMAYNTASTMILRNTELAGFMERYGINIEPPFEMVTGPDGKPTKRYLPAKPGAGTLMAWQQTTIENRDPTTGKFLGETPLGAAQYGRFEPVSPDSLISATNHNQFNMYGEVGQSYVLMGKDATASGRSREVAMSDFDNVRQPTIDLAEYALSEVLYTLAELVAALSNRPGRYRSIEIDGTVRQRVIPPSPEDRDADRQDVAAGIISVAEARQRQGNDDPEQTDAQIARERQQAQERGLPDPTAKQPDPSQTTTPKPPEQQAGAPPTQEPPVRKALRVKRKRGKK